MKKIFVLCCICSLALLAACARQPSLEMTPENQARLEERWQKFSALGQQGSLAPYRLQMSLRFGTEGDTRRVTALFWGNSQRRLRLDVMAGVGATVAKILEDGQHFLVYSPTDDKAYFYQGAAKPLLQVGVPVPFNLEHLADLLNGRYSAVFGKSFATGSLLPGDLAQYTLEGTPGGVLTLDAAGLPVAWSEKGDNSKGWKMEVAYDNAQPSLPQRLTLVHSNGKRAIVLIKDREKPATPFTDEQMTLSIPEGVPLLPLAKYRQP
ncbi:MAG: hypothetical protein DESF_02418 [Desulfovibrio sp.]